ncbi:metallophosphoesterase family protein [Bosea sp. (in: a-proteobacteria)]|uniref:metallophosphoesterase family protein n=1 Tax=Bosea sp. (in: a-proteobacteria) TaxID=1871050 RepID=UPI00260672D2|nr:metallophosphoesterase family protein [Bosea sp. (in: a-proteobacteria)]MCO5090807.1 metallophosphatase family protein [Bosea sp. (in: a-proteobacteria)]
MRIAVLADIHANREALDAVRDVVAALKPDRIVVAGDIVGYGPDPAYAIEVVAGYAANGAQVVLGNHDRAVLDNDHGMTASAHEAVRWTRGQLAAEHRAFLAALPLTVAEEDRLYVHASADEPGRWHYMRDARAAAPSFAATDARLIICGHTHVPMIFYARPGHAPVTFSPLDDTPAPLVATRRHLVVAGSVGQPRDGNPAACFALVDLQQGCVTMRRVPYDSAATAGKILAAGLPPALAARLASGR